MPEDALDFQFADVEQQRAVATLGMWVFLGSEVLFFGGLFLAYIVYRHAYPDAFLAAARRTHIVIGVANTAILLTSSALITMGRDAGEAGRRKSAAMWIGGAAALGAVFLGLKGIEYAKEFSEHLVPGVDFSFPSLAAPGPAEIFYMLYFVMTGLHAIHLSIGIAAAGTVALRLRLGAPPRRNTVEGTTIYWHFVDVMWIFLFGLIYLPGRSP